MLKADIRGMCFQYPGPRCSYHAHKDYISALQAYENAKTGEDKLRTGEILEEKRAAYYSTPRGRNYLRREADASEGLERKKWLWLLEQGETVWAEQTKAYRASIARKNMSLKNDLAERGKSLSKYGLATGMVGVYLADEFPTLPFEIVNADTINIEGFGKILILPPKYQTKLGETKLVDNKFLYPASKTFENILNDTSNTRNLRGDQLEGFSVWFVEKLQELGFVAAAVANPVTQDVAIIGLNRILDKYDSRVKKLKRLGGTTKYAGSVDNLRETLKGTVFEAGSIIVADSINKVLITGVPPQPKTLCHVGNLFLSYHSTGNEEYFEVRRAHESTNYNINIMLKSNKVLFETGVEHEIREQLKAIQKQYAPGDTDMTSDGLGHESIPV